MTPAQATMSRRLDEAEKISVTKAAEAARAAAEAEVAEESAKAPARNYTNMELYDMSRGYGTYSGGIASSTQIGAARSAYTASSSGWPSATIFKEKLAQADREAAEARALRAKAYATSVAQAATAAAAEEKAIRAEYNVLAEVERRLKAEADAAQAKRLMQLAIEREAKKRLEEAEFEAAVAAKMAAMRVAQ